MTHRVGVIGGGQLARMMIPPALEMGIDLRVLAETDDSSAGLAATAIGDYRDLATVRDFAAEVDVVTFDHEHVPVEIVEALEASGVAVHPGSHALTCAQDKAVMRRRLAELDIGIPQWSMATNASDVDAFVAQSASGEVVAKTPRGGYDGKGVRVISQSSEIAEWLLAGPVLLEEKVGFVTEVAQLIARRPSGQTLAWPLVETVQKNGVCSEVLVPGSADPRIGEEAQRMATRIADGLEVTGVLAVEMFVLPDGAVLVNELAMRPHNSGHIFTELSSTSQFEQHLRAVLDWPLGDVSLRAPSGAMVNIFGGVRHDKISEALARDSRVKVHDYGKSARHGRKAGHVSVVGEETKDILEVARTAVASLALDGLA